MTQDLSGALRGLLRTRGVALAATLTLGLGIGVTTLVFGVVDGLVLRPLPFGERTARLLTVHSTHPTQARDWDDSGLSYADLLDLRAESRQLVAVEGLFDRNVSVAGAVETERALGASITPGLFRMLGVAPRLGRDFHAGEGAEPGHEAVALISHSLWQRRFGGDPTQLGRPIHLNGRAVTVIGVMPPGFGFPERHDLWLPYARARDEQRAQRGMLAVALLRPGASRASAQIELDAIAGRLASRHPVTNRGWGMHLLALRELYVAPTTRRSLAVMLGAALLVLLVACANVAGLLLARGIARQQELTVRAALGAGRRRLVRLVLVESLLLCLAGAALGVLTARWGLQALVATTPDPPPFWVQMTVDGRTLAFVAGVALLATLASGLVPALRISRLDLRRGMGAARGAGAFGREQRRVQAALVVGQIAAGLALLVAAALLTRSATRLARTEGGFANAPLLSLRVYLAGDAYDDAAARARAFERVVERLRELPGVVAAAATGAIPTDDGGDSVRIVGDRGSTAAGDELGVQMVPITPQLWPTLGLTLPAGRTFTGTETADPDAAVTIVNQRLATTLWPRGGALGRQLGMVTSDGTRWLRVVGVAPDLVYEELGEQTPQSQLTVYVPAAAAGWRTMALLLRSSGEPARLAAEVPRALRQVDPALASYDLLTMERRHEVTHWGERFLGRTFAGLAGAALLLGCVGSYGLMSYAATRRRRELGLRLAIGATAGDIVRLLLGGGVRLAVAGLLLGLPLAAAAARLLEGLLFEVSAWDPAIWTGLPLLLLGAVLLACWLPARRASLTEPASTLRQE